MTDNSASDDKLVMHPEQLEMVDDMCKSFNSLLPLGTVSDVNPGNAPNSCTTQMGSETVLLHEKPKKHLRRRNRKTKKAENSSSDEDSVLSGESMSTLSDLFIQSNKLDDVKSGAAGPSDQTDSPQCVQGSLLEENTSVKSGAVKKKFMISKSEKIKSGEFGETTLQNASESKQETRELQKKNKENFKSSDQTAEEGNACLTESNEPDSQNPAPDVHIPTTKSSPKKKMERSDEDSVLSGESMSTLSDLFIQRNKLDDVKSGAAGPSDQTDSPQCVQGSLLEENISVKSGAIKKKIMTSKSEKFKSGEVGEATLQNVSESKQETRELQKKNKENVKYSDQAAEEGNACLTESNERDSQNPALDEHIPTTKSSPKKKMERSDEDSVLSGESMSTLSDLFIQRNKLDDVKSGAAGPSDQTDSPQCVQGSLLEENISVKSGAIKKKIMTSKSEKIKSGEVGEATLQNASESKQETRMLQKKNKENFKSSDQTAEEGNACLTESNEPDSQNPAPDVHIPTTKSSPKKKMERSDEDSVLSGVSMSTLSDLFIQLIKLDDVKSGAAGPSDQTDSPQCVQGSLLEENISVKSGAIKKKIMTSKSEKFKSGEVGEATLQNASESKQETRELQKKNKENIKYSDQTAEEGNACLTESNEPDSQNPAPDVHIPTTKSSPKKKMERRFSSKFKNSRNKEEMKFNKYLSAEELRKELESCNLIEGILRINKRNFKEAYVNSPDGGQDILIDGIRNRNRSLEGDEVVVRLRSSDEWRVQSWGTQKTAEVVFIRSKNHPRTAVGTLKLLADKNPNFALFSPRDSRVPRVRIPMPNCPQDFFKNAASYSQVLFLTRITSWFDVRYAVGTLLRSLGTVGEKAAETASILIENEIDVSPYPKSFKQFYPQTFILEEELLKRQDIRKECVFTIDPLTAKDLDDAVSFKKLENGNYEIGVHISDVTYFLAEGTPLDEAVAKRATSTYLVDEVYHMLPPELCSLCSLLPGNDKIAFSVFWEMNAEAEVLKQRFARTIINSCVQLSYEHVQEMIEKPEKVWNAEELPPIYNGFSPSDLVATVQVLHSLAVKLRSKRFSNGALRIDNTKLTFDLDPTLGLPVGFTEYINKDSHRMIEEFMLLANVTVAELLKECLRDISLLRSHSEPHRHMMTEVQATMGSVGIHLDISSAGSLQDSLAQYSGTDMYTRARRIVLSSLCARPMARAKYFCASFAKRPEDFWHYALSVPCYTHFTSPIRRYADVMVHRLLSAALGYADKPNWNVDNVQKIAANCNKQKYNAKRAGEQSVDLFLAIYIKEFGPLEEDAVVLYVRDRSFDVIILSTGCNMRVYTNMVPDLETVFKPEGKVSTMELHWQPSEMAPDPTVQIIQMFSIVKVSVGCASTSLKLEAHLLRPE